MTLKIRNISNGIGDQVCGLYALQAYKNRHPDILVEYYCKKFDWFEDVKDIKIKSYYEYPNNQISSKQTPIGDIDKKNILCRKEWHLLQLGVADIQPCPPSLKRSYSISNYFIILLPFSKGSEIEWSLNDWILLEKQIIELGYKTIILFEINQSKKTTEFLGQSLKISSPKEIIDAILNSYGVIGADSGIIHIAGMYNVPSICITSKSDYTYQYSHTNVIMADSGITSKIQINSIIEKLTFSPPLKNIKKRLFSAGELGQTSNGGIYNTSISSLNGQRYLLSRVEKNSEKERSMWDTSVPFLSKYNHSSLPTESRQLNFHCRIEDFRLFHWKNSLYCGHPMVFFPSGKTVQVISEVDINTNALNVKFFPLLSNRILKSIEKNWVYFAIKEQLYFVYSINPFCVYSFNENGICAPVIEYVLQEKDTWGGIEMLSCSTNPVEFDEDNYLMFFHQRQNGVYAQGILLFDKKTFVPSYFTPVPFYKSTENGGVNPHVCYFMGCVIEGEDVVVTAGIGDSNTEVFSWNKKIIKESLVKLPELNLQKENSILK